MKAPLQVEFELEGRTRGKDSGGETLGDDEGDVVVLFVGTETANLVDDGGAQRQEEEDGGGGGAPR